MPVNEAAEEGGPEAVSSVSALASASENGAERERPRLPSDLVSCVLRGEAASQHDQLNCNNSTVSACSSSTTSACGGLPVFLRYLVHLR